MAKRGRLEIIKDILGVIKENRNAIRKTPLIRKSNLSTSRFSEYFEEITKKGFIIESYEKKDKIIRVTNKGERFLEKYRVIINFIDEFEL